MRGVRDEAGGLAFGRRHPANFDGKPHSWNHELCWVAARMSDFGPRLGRAFEVVLMPAYKDDMQSNFVKSDHGRRGEFYVR